MMTQHELYINDILVDIDKDVNVYLTFQSPIFNSLGSAISNVSRNISLPMTDVNLRAIEMYHLADKSDTTSSTKTFPRRWHTVRYYRNGIQICKSAQGKVIDINEGRINFAFTWGNVESFKNMTDKKLNELTFNATLPWNKKIVYEKNPSAPYGFYNLDCGMGRGNVQYQHPCVTTNFLIEQIALDSHVSINYKKDGRPLTDNYIIPCLTKKSNDAANFSSRYWSKRNDIKIVEEAASGGGKTYKVYLKPRLLENSTTPEVEYEPGCFRDPADLWYDIKAGVEKADTDYFDVTELDKIRIIISPFTIIFSAVAGISHPCFEIKVGPNSICKPTWSFNSAQSAYTYNFPATDVVLDVAQRDVCKIGIGEFAQDVSQTLYFYNGSPTIEVVPYLETLVFGVKDDSTVEFPLAINLPDMKQTEFLQAIMHLNGLFAYAKDENSIDFVSIDGLVKNMPYAQDWTDKLVTTSASPNVPECMEFNFLDFQQKNRCKYDNDEDIKTDYSGFITINNETAGSTVKDFIELPFSASEDSPGLTFSEKLDILNSNGTLTDYKRTARIPLYVYSSDEEGKSNAAYTEGLKPRILRLENIKNKWLKATFANLDWNHLLRTKYKSYQRVIRNPRVLKVRCRLSDIDLSKIDFSIPVTFSQFGNYYAIIKVQSAADGVCKCDFLELKKESSNPPGMPEELN